MYLDTHRSFEDRAADLVAHMTLEEKVAQLQNDAPAIPRLNLPAYEWWNEALHGVARGGLATVFPQAIGLAATFDPRLMHEVATAISDEARAKHQDGLSYTQFQYSGLKVDRARVGEGDRVNVSVDVKNVGPRAGDEVVQLYVRELAPEIRRAEKSLRGIERLSLQPGETRHATFSLVPNQDFTHYDVEHKRYAVNDGSYEVQLGASSSDIKLKSTVVVNAH